MILLITRYPIIFSIILAYFVCSQNILFIKNLMEIPQSKMKEICLDMDKMNSKLLMLAVPFLIVFAIPFLLIWPVNFAEEISEITIKNIFSTLVVLFAGVIVHELIHGLFWSFFTKKGFLSIKFGIMWSSFTPYCHCKEPMKLKYYRVGAVMPAIVLGFIPAIISIFTGNFGLLVFGLFFSIAAGGDLLMLWMLRKESNASWVQDHPDKIGCFIYGNAKEEE